MASYMKNGSNKMVMVRVWLAWKNGGRGVGGRRRGAWRRRSALRKKSWCVESYGSSHLTYCDLTAVAGRERNSSLVNLTNFVVNVKYTYGRRLHMSATCTEYL